MARTIKIENTTVSSGAWMGKLLAVNEVYDMTESDIPNWFGDSSVLTDIDSGDLKLIKSEGPTVYYTVAEAQKIYAGVPDLVLTGGQGYQLLCTNPSGTVVWSQGTVIVQEEGVQVGSIPFNTLNFVGADITATDAGSGQANITVTSGGASTLAAIQARRTTTLLLTTSFVDFTYDTTDVENDTTVVEHDNTNTDRITIKETGLYLISYAFEIDYSNTGHITQGRVRVNDTTVLPGSECEIQQSAINPQMVSTECVFVAELTALDFVTVQIKSSNASSETTQPNSQVSVIRLRGTKGDKGDKGDTGGGSNIVVQDDGVTVSGGPHDTINFVDMIATDAGGGAADVTNLFGSEYETAASEADSSTTSSSFVEKLKLTTASLTGGTYRIGWYCEINNTDNTGKINVQVQLDDTTNLADVVFEPKDPNNFIMQSGFSEQVLSAATHDIDIDFNQNGSGTAHIRKVRIEIWRVA